MAVLDLSVKTVQDDLPAWTSTPDLDEARENYVISREPAGNEAVLLLKHSM